jgi:DNA-binding NtrC family response regulator
VRALQERQVEPVGGEGPVSIDVRFVATTNRDLRAEVEAGRFREDLYYRLAVVPLDVPPLRVRTEDIGALAEALLTRAALRIGSARRTLAPQALERLVAHAWPGNVRELENALERVLALGPRQGPIEVEELGFLEEGLRGVAEELARSAMAHGIDLDGFQRAMLEEALRLERGNLSAAARRVGLTRRAFEYRTGRRGGAREEGA